MRIGGAVIAKNEGLNGYLRAIQGFPMLTAEDERQLAQRWRAAGDTTALDKLVTSHLRLVAKMSRRFAGYGLPVADLVAAGNLGLMRAVRRFDPERGFRLATYATWWIRAEIQEYVLDSWSLVRIGRNSAQKKLFFSLRRLKAEMKAIDDGVLTPAQVTRIAAALDVPEHEVVDMDGRLSGRDASLNVPQAEDGEIEWQDNLADGRPDQEMKLADEEQSAQRQVLVSAALSKLNERERCIIVERRLRDDPVTLDVLSARYGVSRERIRQIENRAFAKIRAYALAPATHQPIGAAAA